MEWGFLGKARADCLLRRSQLKTHRDASRGERRAGLRPGFVHVCDSGNRVAPSSWRASVALSRKTLVKEDADGRGRQNEISASKPMAAVGAPLRFTVGHRRHLV
jgi:hypothetical protein